MHFRYIVIEHQHICIHETDGSVRQDMNGHLLVQPDGARFVIDIPVTNLLGVSL